MYFDIWRYLGRRRTPYAYWELIPPPPIEEPSPEELYLQRILGRRVAPTIVRREERIRFVPRPHYIPSRLYLPPIPEQYVPPWYREPEYPRYI